MIKNLNYNYVVFNMHDNKWFIDHKGYYTICMEDLFDNPSIVLVTWPLDYASIFIRLLFNIHNSGKINLRLNLPFKKLWYPYYFKDKFHNEKPYCFVIIDYTYPESYFQYLKKHYPNCKIVLLHRDLLSRRVPHLHGKDVIDYEMSYDKNEASKYNMVHFNEFESKIDIPVSNNYPESDVFFAGNIKDRLEKVLSAYKVFSESGLRCKFYLVGVDKEKRVMLEGVEYGDSFIPYSEMLYHSVNSRCILEINQDNADGYTSRFLEAVMFNKKLITNNTSIKGSEFYTPDYIQIVDDFSRIDTEFVKRDMDVDYRYDGQFSPLKLIERIDSVLYNNKESNL